MSKMIELLFQLVCMHILADFVFQTDIMAKLKNRHNKPDWIPNGQKYVPCWPYWLSAHAIVHGGGVYLVTGSVVYGMIEIFAHGIIDFLKCENKTNPNQDQFLHYLCKLGYIL